MATPMAAKPSMAASACLNRNGFTSWPWSRASAPLAEYTMIRPSPTSATTVLNRTRSKARRLAIQTELPHETLELVPAIIEIAELIEARTGRRQHHRFAGRGARAGQRHGAVQRARRLERHGAGERRFELGRGFTDEVGARRLARHHLAQRAQVRPLVAAAQDQVHRAVGEVLERARGGRHVG